MSSASFTVEWPKKDVDALFRSMEMAVKYLNYDMGHALKAAAKHLIQSIAASTRIAPKFREIKDATWLAPGAKKPRRGLHAYDVTGWFGYPRKQMTKQVYSRDMATAKRRHATIGRRGLARATWSVAARSMSGIGALFSASSSHTARVAAKYADSRSQFSGEDLFVEVNNFLPYAESALEGGPKDINSAMERAAAGMEKSIERQLVKRMGLGSLSR